MATTVDITLAQNQVARSALDKADVLPLVNSEGATAIEKVKAVRLAEFATDKVSDRHSGAPMSARASGQFFEGVAKKIDAIHDPGRSAASTWTVTPQTIDADSVGYSSALDGGTAAAFGSIAPNNDLSIGGTHWRLIRVSQDTDGIRMQLGAPLEADTRTLYQSPVGGLTTSALLWTDMSGYLTPPTWRLPTDSTLVFRLTGGPADGVSVTTATVRGLTPAHAGDSYNDAVGKFHVLGNYGGTIYAVGRTDDYRLLFAHPGAATVTGMTIEEIAANEPVGAPAALPAQTDFRLEGEILHARDADTTITTLTRDIADVPSDEARVELLWPDQPPNQLASGTDATLELLGAPPAKHVPAGGAEDQVLSKASADDYDVAWADPEGGLPAGGTTGQVLKKSSNADGDVAWGPDLTAAPGAGQDQAAVQAEIAAKVRDFAEQDKNVKVPINRLGMPAATQLTSTQILNTDRLMLGRGSTWQNTSIAHLGLKLGVLDQDAVDARVTALRPNAFTNADERKLDELSDGGITEDEGTFTAITNVADIEAQRTPGQTPQGSFTGDSNLLRIHLDGSSGNITAVLTGGASEYQDGYLRLGDRHLKFSQATLATPVGSNIEYSWQSDYSGWIVAGSEAWAVVRPLETKDLVPDQTGHAGQVLRTDGTTAAWSASTRPEAIAALPVPLVANQRYILTAADSIDNSKSISALQESATLRGIELNEGDVSGIRGYIPTYSGPSATTLRDRVVLVLHGNVASRATFVRLGTALGSLQDYAVSAAIVPGNQHTYLVAGLTYADIAPGTNYFCNVQFADDSFVYPPTAVEPGDWTALTARTLTHTPGSSATWAESGNDDPLPTNKLPYQTSPWARTGNVERIPASKAPVPALDTIFDRDAGPGLIINGSSGDARSGITAPTPAFDFDTPGYGAGVFEIEVDLVLSNRLSNTIAFQEVANQDEAADALTKRVSGIVTISSLKALQVYDPSTIHAIEIGQVAIYKGNAELGDAIIYISKDANNQIGLWMLYEGEAGSENFTLSTTVTGLFQHQDAGPDAADTYKQSIITPSLAATVIATGGTVQVSLAGATLTDGITVANNRIVLRDARRYEITFSLRLEMTTDPDVPGGGARSYVDHVAYLRRGSVNTNIKRSRGTDYIRTTSDATGTAVGPDQESFTSTFTVIAQAGDEIGISLIAGMIQPSGASIQIHAADSEVAVTYE